MYNQRRRQQQPMTPEDMARRQQAARAQQESLKKFVEKMTSPGVKKAASVLVVFVLLGIFIGTMAPSPVSMNDKDHSKYQSALVAADHVPGYHKALDDLNHEQSNVDAAKVWFWRFRR